MSSPQVLPNTWFCEGGTGGCREIRASIGPLLRLPTRRPPVLRVAAPPGWVTASLLLLAITTVAVAAAGLLWGRRQHRRYIASLAGAAGCQRLVSECPAAASSVLLLHLARSDAERAAVRQLAAELGARGAAVTDSDSPQWRSAARMDATGLASAVPAFDRVLLLSSPAAAAAAAAGSGGGERERLFAAAVRQLTGSGLTSNYGRVYQARLTAEAPTVAGLVTGAAYTLPEHQHELVAALLTGIGTDTDSVPPQTTCPETLAADGVVELTL